MIISCDIKLFFYFRFVLISCITIWPTSQSSRASTQNLGKHKIRIASIRFQGRKASSAVQGHSLVLRWIVFHHLVIDLDTDIENDPTNTHRFCKIFSRYLNLMQVSALGPGREDFLLTQPLTSSSICAQFLVPFETYTRLQKPNRYSNHPIIIMDTISYFKRNFNSFHTSFVCVSPFAP